MKFEVSSIICLTMTIFVLALNRWLREIQLETFPWNGIRMRPILDMTLLGRRLRRKNGKINWIRFLQVPMTLKIGEFIYHTFLCNQ